MGMRIIFYYLIVFLAVPILLGITLQLLGLPLPQVREGQEPDLGVLLLVQSLMLPAVCVVTLLWLRRVDRKSPAAIGLGWPGGDRSLAVRQVTASLVGAVALLTAWALLVAQLVEVRIERASSSPSEIFGLIAGFLAVACYEEWVFRGYIYSTLRERLPWVHAAGMSAVLFTMLHLGIPGTETAGLFNIFLLGLFLAAVREATGSVWTVVAFQGAWNIFLGVVLSLPVSGLDTPRLFKVTLEGDPRWTGGDFGPEGSWPMVAILFAALVVVARALPEPESDAPPDAE